MCPSEDPHLHHVTVSVVHANTHSFLRMMMVMIMVMKVIRVMLVMMMVIFMVAVTAALADMKSDSPRF